MARRRALACSKPPAGRTRWTLQLLAGEDTGVDDVGAQDTGADDAEPPPVGYFVLSAGSWPGNLGGLGGADSNCQQDLSSHDWLGKPSILDPGKVHAFLCDDSTCRGLAGGTQFFFAVSGEPSLGGASFTTTSPNGSTTGDGPGDDAAWSMSSRFGSSTSYWTGYRWHASDSLWTDTVHLSGYSCNSWQSKAFTGDGVVGDASSTTYQRWEHQFAQTCDQEEQLICVVEP